MKQLIIITIIISYSLTAISQNERKHIRSGNKIYMKAAADTTKIDSVAFGKAETEYRKAIEKKPTDIQWNFNLADAIYKQKRFDEAAGKFEEIADKMPTTDEKARAFHNLGNSQLMGNKIDESIESYKKALRKNPTDLETKYNLAYAQLLKKKKDQQDKNQDKDKENQDKNKDQQKQDKQDQNKDQQNQNQQQQAQNKISKENAEQLLQALQNDERNIQDKVKKIQAAQAKSAKLEKEW